MCPGTHGNQFASACEYDEDNDSFICICNVGFTGEKCEECEINHFGDPRLPGGKCMACECNGNIDIDDPDSCDKRTGKCLKCLYGTDGDSCEKCKAGYYGDALTHGCTRKNI